MSCSCAAGVTKAVIRTPATRSVVGSRAFVSGAAPLRRVAAAAPVRADRSATMQLRALFGGSAATAGSLYDYTVKGIDGKDIKMDRFKGKVLLVINVASACGFTPQYTEMSQLYDKYASKGLEVLAFPCNQFGGQEPGSNSEVKAFAQKKGFTGPLFAKTDVNGPNAEPLFTYLKTQQGGLLGSDIKWNFTKFLVDRSGKVVKRYGSTTAPLAIEADIKALL